jgi:hypothetical protein
LHSLPTVRTFVTLQSHAYRLPASSDAAQVELAAHSLFLHASFKATARLCDGDTGGLADLLAGGLMLLLELTDKVALIDCEAVWLAA